jgi:hypothetical protein
LRRSTPETGSWRSSASCTERGRVLLSKWSAELPAPGWSAQFLAAALSPGRRDPPPAPRPASPSRRRARSSGSSCASPASARSRGPRLGSTAAETNVRRNGFAPIENEEARGREFPPNGSAYDCLPARLHLRVGRRRDGGRPQGWSRPSRHSRRRRVSCTSSTATGSCIGTSSSNRHGRRGSPEPLRQTSDAPCNRTVVQTA